MPDIDPPARGFPHSEFEARTARAQEAMAQAGASALLVCTEPEVRYFTGFLSQFWESPTRPWFVVVPSDGKPIAAIPEIGRAGMESTWIDDIRTWPAPRPDDDGIGILADAISQARRGGGALAVPIGRESSLRMPLADFEKLRGLLPGMALLDAEPWLRRQRFVKSEAEIAKIRHICQIASDAFQALPDRMAVGLTEREICKAFRLDLLSRGADSAPYLIGGSGPAGYDNIIMGPTDRPIEDGDVFIIDTGGVYDGYFCDFDRNWGFGALPDDVMRAHEIVWDATEAGLDAARPGAATTDVWRAMQTALDAGGALGNDVGRLGHGLGMQLTEGPSNMPGDDTPLEPGAVLTLEPGMTFAPGRMMVHEENIVIRDGPPEILTKRAPREMPVIR